MKSIYNILVINPGSTSTKVALFQNEQKLSFSNIPVDETRATATLWEQFEPRLLLVRNYLQQQNLQQLHAVAGRGGLIKPVRSGTYEVNETMLDDARKGVQGQHPANLGCALAKEIANSWQCKAFIVDPVSVDEFEPCARYSGHPLIERRALSHVLNIRALARRAAKELNLDLEKTKFIVAHLGGGISVAVVNGGRIIDVNDASSAGPFSPERSGSLPMIQFIDLCFSEQYSKDEMKRMIMGQGGLKAYLGTSDMVKIESRISAGEKRAAEIFDAMIYQIAKEIGAASCVLSGHIDAIILSGGLTNSQRLVDRLTGRIKFLAPILTFKGEFEMEALAFGVLRVLNGEEVAQIYA